MGHVSKAAAVTPPVIGENTWGLDADDINPATYIAVPDDWKNAILRFTADGEAFVFAFGDETLTTVSATAASTISGNAITVQGSIPYALADGQSVDVDMALVDANKKKRFACLGETGTAGNILRITRTSGYVQ